jgi:hypothetical protein
MRIVAAPIPFLTAANHRNLASKIITSIVAASFRVRAPILSTLQQRAHILGSGQPDGKQGQKPSDLPFVNLPRFDP